MNKHTISYNEDAIKRSIKLQYVKEIKKLLKQTMNLAQDWYYNNADSVLEYKVINKRKYHSIISKLNDTIKLLEYE